MRRLPLVPTGATARNQTGIAHWLLVYLFFALAAAAVLLTGACGGGGSSSRDSGGRTKATGSVAITMTWPDQGARLIPAASSSIQASLERAGADNPPVPPPKLLPRPAQGGGTASAVFEGVEVGAYVLKASALPNADGSGVAQAQGAVPVTVIAGQTAEVRLTMTSTIVRIDVSPADPALLTGDTVALTATCRNAAGEVVLHLPGNLRWRSENPGAASADAATGVVTGVAASPTAARIVATETESAVEGATGVTVRQRPEPGTGPLWPRHHGNQFNTGFSTMNPIGSGGRVWFHRTYGEMRSSPAVGADGTVYIGVNQAYANENTARSRNGIYGSKMLAFYPWGGVKWEHAFGANIGLVGSPSIGPDGTIYVVGQTEGGILFAFDGQTGALKWQQYGYQWDCCPVVTPDNRLYALNQDSKLRSLNPDTGEVLWEFVPSSRIFVMPAMGSRNSNGAIQDVVYLADDGGILYSVDAFTGKENWRFQAEGDFGFQTPPVVNPVDFTVYVCAPYGALWAVDEMTGAQIWQKNLEWRIIAAPAVGPDGTLYVTLSGSGSGGYFSVAFALNGTTGERLWMQEKRYMDAAVASPTVVAAGMLYLTANTSDGTVVQALDTRNGNRVWEEFVGSRMFDGTSPAIGRDGMIYVGTADGVLHALGSVIQH